MGKEVSDGETTGREVLGSDVDASYLGEIQGIESLMLVPALVGTRALTMRPARLSAVAVPKSGRPLAVRLAL